LIKAVSAFSPRRDQALVQSVQRPEIIGMLAGAAQLAVKTEIGAVYRLGFLDSPLLEEKRPSAWRVGCIHPHGSS
jgi:hypothetical protein